jgi:uncharacterized membrane protein
MTTRPIGLESQDETGTSSLLIASTAAALCTLLPVAAHQLRLLKHLPDPPCGFFASDEITDSKTAHPFGIPDSLLGLGSYGTTLSLMLLSKSRPTARKLLAAKLLADGAVAGFNVVRQIVLFRKVCFWCCGTALCTGLMVLAGREVIATELSPTHKPPV